MADYGHDLLFGVFLSPAAPHAGRTLRLAKLADSAGLDLVTVQDHPYQPAFLDAWTLLSVIAANTQHVRVAANVANLPLRPPAVLAKSVASLDILSGGRAELGLGAGAFWDGVATLGGPRRTPGEALEALEEAIAVIRALWSTGGSFDGRHYRLDNAQAGPMPPHDPAIWVGGIRPRMLRLIGRLADGWLPSMAYVPPSQLGAGNRLIDEAAAEAGRDPAAVRRLYNIGPRDAEPAFLAELALEHGMSTFILAGDDPAAIQAYAEEVAPAVRELVAKERGTPEPQAPAVEALWDEATRPHAPAVTGGRSGEGEHLVEVHDHLRGELAQLKEIMAQVVAGSMDPAAARGAINQMTVRQNNWTLGAYCASYCRLVTTHHTLEDQSLFPHLRRADPRLAPVLDRLEQEHHVIHGVLEEVDRALVALVGEPDGMDGFREAVARLDRTLSSHLRYEEEELVPALSRHGFR
ncbi:LLM class flavin-dependent oxidoreductase [Nonomuraea sp. NPDC050328]|uniref:LLM class flavin-dependent oxidoreductase n=1 Tax=Nonomuraea sp. NPDC050328 TaxID=3364361 RepID=UPI0037BCBB20